MSDDDSSAFDRRFRGLLAKTGDAVVPSPTPERREALRQLFMASRAAAPHIALVWKRVVAGTDEIIALVKAAGVTCMEPPAVAVRDGGDGGGNAPVNVFTLPLPEGELVLRVYSAGRRRAKVYLAVKGEYAARKDVWVELSLEDDLIEARPLEHNAEFTLDGTGDFMVALFAGGEEVRRVGLHVDGAARADGAGDGA